MSYTDLKRGKNKISRMERTQTQKKPALWEACKKRAILFIERNSYWKVLLYSLAGMAVVFLLAYFFYRSWMAVPFLIPIGAYVTFYLDEEKQKKESEVLKKQFREMILAVATNLKAGYSIENSFTEARADMIRLYGNNGQIVRELWNIENALKVNQTLEQQLYRFANKCRIEEVMDFAEIFSIAKRMGGNLAEIIDNTAIISAVLSIKIGRAHV